MAIYEQLCGCVVEIIPELRGVRSSSTRLITECGAHKPLSFGGAQALGAGTEGIAQLPPQPEADVSEFGVPKKGRSVLGRIGDMIFSGVRIDIPKLDGTSHTLCDEHIDFINLTLSRERVELLEERRHWAMLRQKDRAAGANRITEIDAELAMIDAITLKLRRHA